MTNRLMILGIVLTLSGLILSGCGSGPADSVEVPDSVLQARDAALAIIRERYAAEAPTTGLDCGEHHTGLARQAGAGPGGLSFLRWRLGG